MRGCFEDVPELRRVLFSVATKFLKYTVVNRFWSLVQREAKKRFEMDGTSPELGRWYRGLSRGPDEVRERPRTTTRVPPPGQLESSDW